MAHDQFKHITMQQLESLAYLVEERNFSRAAKRMLLSQPSLSKHIKNLEIFVDADLLIRTKAGISLTDEGTILYGYAKRILRLRDEARQKILLKKNTLSGHIFIGASTIPATYILPSVITGLKRIHPDIQTHILTGDSDEVIEMVLDSRTDLGFIGKQTHDRRLYSEPFWKDELILVVNRDHRWGSSAPVSIEELSKESFVIRENGSATRSIFDEHLKVHDYKPLNRFNIISEMGSSEAVKEAVISGLGVSIISIHAVRRELKQGILLRIPVEGPAIKRYFHVIHKSQSKPLIFHRAFMDFARTYKIEY